MSERARLPLGALLAGHTLSRTGNVVTLFAVPFAVLGTGGGPIDVGVAAAAASAPVLIGGPLGGALVDRVGYVRSAALADVVSGATLLLIPILSLFGLLPFPMLLVLVFLSGLLDVPGETARQTMLPSLSAGAGMPLERSVGFLDTTTRLSTLLGAPLAGVLVATVGAFPALFVTAAAFGASALITATLVRLPPGAADSGGESRGYWRDLREGMRFVVRDPLLRGLVALVFVTNTLDAARGGTLMPLYATRELDGAASLGLISGVFGAAALTGSLAFGFFAHRLPRRVPFAICFTVAGCFAFAPALGWGTAGLVATAVVCGLAAGALNPIIGAVELDRVPRPMRARVLGMITAGAWAGIPLGGLLGGLSVDLVGLRSTFGIIAIVYVSVTVVPFFGGAWRLMERDRPISGENAPDPDPN